MSSRGDCSAEVWEWEEGFQVRAAIERRLDEKSREEVD